MVQVPPFAAASCQAPASSTGGGLNGAAALGAGETLPVKLPPLHAESATARTRPIPAGLRVQIRIRLASGPLLERPRLRKSGLGRTKGASAARTQGAIIAAAVPHLRQYS
jgi:hypothetical protein